MSWIQENKFASALAGVTLVGSIGLIALSSQKSGEYDEASAALTKALKQEHSLQTAVPYPNAENLEAKKANVDAYAESAVKLQEEFSAYRPTAEEIADVAPTEFSKMVGGYRSRLNEKFEAAGAKVPDGAYYGFEAYASKLPRAEATGELLYQMKALEWMFTALAEKSPEALINVVRPKMLLESEAVKVATKKKRSKKRKGKKGKKGKNAQSTAKNAPIYDLMPLEFSFRGTEAQLKGFLEDLSNSPKYYTAIRAVRIQNERLTAPNVSDVKFQSQDDLGAGGSSDFGDFVVEETVEASSETAATEGLPSVASDSDDSLLLAQILGAEKLNVFVRLEILLLKPEPASTKAGMKN